MIRSKSDPKVKQITAKEYQQLLEKKKKSKYRNKKVKDGGFTFDSMKEHERWLDLCTLQKDGKIMGLKVHPSYPISVNFKHVCKVILDFTYFDCEKGIHIYEDVKGFYTSESKLKHKLFEAISNDKVTII